MNSLLVAKAHSNKVTGKGVNPSLQLFYGGKARSEKAPKKQNRRVPNWMWGEDGIGTRLI
jgi:hypothetical protein